MDVSIKHVLQVNEGKRKVVKWKGEAYASYAIRTCVVTEKHSLSGLIEEYVQPYIKPGDVVNIPAGVKHWHGAVKDSWFSHLAVEVPGEDTENEWCEAVTEEQYEK